MPHTVGTANLTIPRTIICLGDALLPLNFEELGIPRSIPIKVTHHLPPRFSSPFSRLLWITCIISTDYKTLFLPYCSLANAFLQRKLWLDFVTKQKGILRNCYFLLLQHRSSCSNKVKGILPHAILKKSILPFHFIIFSLFSLQLYIQTRKYPTYRGTDFTSLSS